MLLGGDPTVLSPNPVKILHSRDAKGSGQYVEAVDNYMNDHRLEHRMIRLGTDGGKDRKLGEAIDCNILWSMEHGMNKIRKIYVSPFSPQITQARLQWRFYKVYHLMITNYLDLRNQLRLIESTFEIMLPAPRNCEEAQALLRAAQKNVKDLNKKAATL
jgi:hypothetical protein